MGRRFGPKGGAERGLRQVPTARASSSLTNVGDVRRGFAAPAAHVGGRVTIDASIAREPALQRRASGWFARNGSGLSRCRSICAEGPSRRDSEREERPRWHGTGHCSKRLRRCGPLPFRLRNSFLAAVGVAAAAQALTSCPHGLATRWRHGRPGLPWRLRLPPRLLAGTVDGDCVPPASEGGMP